MIANCPGCGTHYKHEPPVVRVRARCGRCDASLDLARLRPYRIAAVAAPTAEQARRAANHLPIGLDHPALATTIAENVERHETHIVAPPVIVAPPLSMWLPDDSAEPVETEVPLPPTPEMAPWAPEDSLAASTEDGDVLSDDTVGIGADPFLDDVTPQESSPEGGAATVALWMVVGTIVGTGGSWMLGGTTITGMSVGAACGAVSCWVWLRWTSPK